MIKRHILAGIIAPLMVIIVYCIFAIGAFLLANILYDLHSIQSNNKLGMVYQIIHLSVVYGLPIAYAVQIIVGFPVVFTLKRYDGYTRTNLLVCGGLAGFLPPLIFFHRLEFTSLSLICMVSGIFAAWIYWIIAGDFKKANQPSTNFL
jgi:hypothetical protein